MGIIGYQSEDSKPALVSRVTPVSAIPPPTPPPTTAAAAAATPSTERANDSTTTTTGTCSSSTATTTTTNTTITNCNTNTATTVGVTAAAAAAVAAALNMSVELCLVCGDRASGRHYGAISCEGCKGFFKRSIRKQLGYQCRGTMNCEVTKHHRNRCQFCRLQKCLASGMRSDSVQHERKPIVDKKDPNLTGNSSSGSSVSAVAGNSGGAAGSGNGNPVSGSSAGGGAANSSAKSGSPLYQSRNKQNAAAAAAAAANIFGHAGATGGATNAAVAAAAAAAAFPFEDNIAARVFPIGLNFAELTQTLMLASQQQQQQQQAQQQQQSSSLCYSPDMKPLTDDADDDDSMDNSSTLCLQSLAVAASNNNNNAMVNSNNNNSCSSNNNNNNNNNNNMNNSNSTMGNNGSNLNSNNNNSNSNNNQNNNNNANTNIQTNNNNNNNNVTQSLKYQMDVTTPTTAVGLIQSSLDKRVIYKALGMLSPIQQQLDRGIPVGSGNSNASSGGGPIAGLKIKNEIDDDDMADGSGLDDDSDHMEMDEVSLMGGTTGVSGGDAKEFIANECVFETDLLSASQATFNLQAPALVSAYLNIHYVCESGSRIIFLSVYWLRKVAAFEQLDERSQMKLLRAAWPSLLALALAQARNLSVATIMSTLINNIRQLADIDKIEPHKIRKLSEHTARLHAFVQEMIAQEPDDMEYALLRLAVVFNPHVLQRRRESSVRAYVRRVQMHALNALRTHSNGVGSASVALSSTADKCAESSDERYNALLMNLMPLSSLESDVIEELFFANLVGQVQIDNMIPYILTLSASTV